MGKASLSLSLTQRGNRRYVRVSGKLVPMNRKDWDAMKHVKKRDLLSVVGKRIARHNVALQRGGATARVRIDAIRSAARELRDVPCHINRGAVKRFVDLIGASREVAGKDVRNVCAAIGSALRGATRSEPSPGRAPWASAKQKASGSHIRALSPPKRVLGTGVAGLVFELRDGTVLKAVSLGKTANIARGNSGSSRGEFFHEAIMTRDAARTFNRKGSRAGFRVPKLCDTRVLRIGKAEIGLMRLAKVRGKSMASVMERNPSSRKKMAMRLGRLLATIHNRGFVHCDLHAENVMVGPGGKLIVLDWARAQRLKFFVQKGRSDLWRSLLSSDAAFAAFDLTRSDATRFVKDFLDAYRRRAVAKHAIDYDAILKNPRRVFEKNFRSVWIALDLATGA